MPSFCFSLVLFCRIPCKTAETDAPQFHRVGHYTMNPIIHLPFVYKTLSFAIHKCCMKKIHQCCMKMMMMTTTTTMMMMMKMKEGTYPAITALEGRADAGFGLKGFFRGNPTCTGGFDFLNDRLDLPMALCPSSSSSSSSSSLLNPKNDVCGRIVPETFCISDNALHFDLSLKTES
jgi:hypothetical protein